jgi:23S rRNA pseudouridine1911/1915/1917 synthase
MDDAIIVIDPKDDGVRLDVFLLARAPAGTTRGDVQRAIKMQRVTVDEKQKIKPGSALHAGQTLRVRRDAWAPFPPARLTPDTSLPLHLLHEDPQLLVVDKPAGLPVHAGVRHAHPTLAPRR